MASAGQQPLLTCSEGRGSFCLADFDSSGVVTCTSQFVIEKMSVRDSFIRSFRALSSLVTNTHFVFCLLFCVAMSGKLVSPACQRTEPSRPPFGSAGVARVQGQPQGKEVENQPHQLVSKLVPSSPE